MRSLVVLLIFWKGRQDSSFPVYRLKNMLIWVKGFVFAILEKVISVYIPSRVIRIRFDRRRPPGRTRFKRIF